MFCQFLLYNEVSQLKYACIISLLDHSPTPTSLCLPSHLPRSLQSTELSSLYYTARGDIYIYIYIYSYTIYIVQLCLSLSLYIYIYYYIYSIYNIYSIYILYIYYIQLYIAILYSYLFHSWQYMYVNLDFPIHPTPCSHPCPRDCCLHLHLCFHPSNKFICATF